ncbi:hypothetical protein GJ744_011466 [Endocarpon pusillum]|uniref:Uncharacterized protein n=1 Tax=Endocarpon pusillum TaxID=364733 RepID=A0A8H7E294_9EURO|nr:hypothetical protein GJ744_011466 [Endocarpon pusillum]
MPARSFTRYKEALPNIGKNDPVVMDISCFTIAKILDKRPSPFGVEYRCELGPVWLSSVFGERDTDGRRSHPGLRKWTYMSRSSGDIEG